MPSAPVAAIILAAGKGTRMKSDLPKGLHALCGAPLVQHVGRAMHAAGVRRPVIVIGHGGDLIRSRLGDEQYAYAWQHEQLGTGHAALMAREALESHVGPVIVMPGDVPLVSPDTLSRLLETHAQSGAQATLAVIDMDDPTGYGRIIRDAEGYVTGIVEEKDCTPEQKVMREVNPSVYVFDRTTLFEVLPKLGRQNAQGEYLLTDAIGAIAASGGRVVAVKAKDQVEFWGINDRWQLAMAAKEMRRAILKKHAMAGVTIIDPDTTYVGSEVTLEADVTLEPMTVLDGKTSVEGGSVIGPNSRVIDSAIGEGCTVLMSNLNGATLGRGVKVGPFAHLRPKSRLGDGVKIGNFVETKNAVFGDNASLSHLTYCGDAEVGASTNIGAGTITCNYDGFGKHLTKIGEGAFVGSNSTLVAPVEIGPGAVVAAGSTITHNVPADALGIGRGKQENKVDWAAQWRKRKLEGRTKT